MEDKAKIFIASSQVAIELAKALKNWFSTKSQGYIDPIPWNEFKAGAQAVSDKLMQAAREDFDFAVIILTQDDVGIEEDKEKRTPRDNCIFEAGLFMGTLGYERCFLVCSVKHEDIASDMQNLDRYNIEQPNNLGDPDACIKVIDDAPDLDNILQAIKKQGKRPKTYQSKFVSIDDKLSLENSLKRGCVAVSSDYPSEYGYKFLYTASNNIRRGVKYKYFFHADISNAESICLLLQMLLIAKYLKEQDQGGDKADQIRVARDNYEEIRGDLKDIIEKFDSLKVYLLPHEPTFRFSVHLGESENEHKVYIRISGKDGFLQFEEGQNALVCYNKLKKLIEEGDDEERVFVWMERFCKFEQSEILKFKKAVFRNFKELFPKNSQEIFDLCWGEKR